MILHARSIGDDVHIRHNTTFGVVRRDCNTQIPVIEDRVDIGCGVCVLGDVRVGQDSVIGSNAVVLDDIPPCSVAVGVPARVVKRLPPPSGAASEASNKEVNFPAGREVLEGICELSVLSK
jgi:serine O-acetyltransferase